MSEFSPDLKEFSKNAKLAVAGFDDDFEETMKGIKNGGVADQNEEKISDEQEPKIESNGETEAENQDHGEIGFHPEKEVKKIHSGTKEEQKLKLYEFKKKLIEQKKGIAEIQKKLLKEMEKNPDASSEEYLKSIQELFEKFDLSNEQRIAFEKGIYAYSRSHHAIKENTKDYINKKTGEIDGLALYEKLFNQKPNGRIEVILRPAMIYIRIENLDDYVIARSKGDGTIDSITDKEKEELRKSAGCLLSNFNMLGLQNSIALENATNGTFDDPVDYRTLRHESQHVLNVLIKHGYSAEQNKLLSKLVSDNPYLSQEHIKKKYAEDITNIKIEDRIKDEISAFFKSGDSVGDIRDSLLNPNTIYDYGFDYKGGDKEKAEFSQEYIKLVNDGISAYSDLLDAGYSKEDAQALLYVEPLSKWPKVVERITTKIKSPEEQEAEKVLKGKIEKLEKEIAEARKEYLEVECKKSTALERIRKYFFPNSLKKAEKANAEYVGKVNNSEPEWVTKEKTKSAAAGEEYKEYSKMDLGKHSLATPEANKEEIKKMESYERDLEVAELRAYYDNKLFELQKLKMEQAKADGVTDPEKLAEIYVGFRTEQKITLTSEHDNIKAEQRLGTKWGRISEKAASALKWYQGLPLKTKLKVSGAFIAGGVILAIPGLGVGLGTTVASIFAGSVTARRIFGGAMAGYGMKGYIDAKGQQMDIRAIEKEKEEYRKKLEALSGDERYNLLAKKIRDKAIKDGEESIEGHARRKGLSTAAGVALGVFIGGGYMADFAKWGISGISEKLGLSWGHGGGANMHKAGAADLASSREFDPSNVRAGVLPDEKIPEFDPSNVRAGVLPDEKIPEFDPSNVRAGVLPDENLSHAPASGGYVPIEQTVEHVQAHGAGHIEVPKPTIDANGHAHHSGIIKALQEHLKGNPSISDPKQASETMFANAAKEYAKSHNISVGEATERLSRINPGTEFEVVGEGNKLHLNLNDKNIKFMDGGGTGQHISEGVSAENVNEIPNSDEVGTAVENAVVDQDITNEMHSYSAGLQSEMNNMNEIPASGTFGMSDFDAKFNNSDLHRLLVDKSISDNPYTKNTVVEIKNHIFGKSAKVFSALKGENIAEIMKSGDAKEAFLKKITTRSGKTFFNELMKQVPPKPGDTTIKWLVCRSNRNNR